MGQEIDLINSIVQGISQSVDISAKKLQFLSSHQDTLKISYVYGEKTSCYTNKEWWLERDMRVAYAPTRFENLLHMKFFLGGWAYPAPLVFVVPLLLSSSENLIWIDSSKTGLILLSS